MRSPRDRRLARLRERGRPARAEVLAAVRRDGDEWLLTLRVHPSEGDPFEATASLEWEGDAGPPAGGWAEVLHAPGRRGPVVLVGHPTPPPAPEPPPAPPMPAPDLGAVLKELVRAAGDGRLAQGAPIVVRDDDPGGPGGGPASCGAPRRCSSEPTWRIGGADHTSPQEGPDEASR
ncbi:MAG: hypothetical protein AB7V62_07560 [Thermoleophilia bacterium]